MADIYGVDRNGPQVTITVGSTRVVRNHQYRFVDLYEAGSVVSSWDGVEIVVIRTPDPCYIEMGKGVALRLRKGWGLKTKFVL